jgi:hypothetical protein
MVNSKDEFSHRCRSISSSNGSMAGDVAAVSCRKVVIGISLALASPENNC